LKESERIVKAIFEAVDEVNQGLPKSQRLRKSMDCVLSGPSGTLDSLGLVNFVVAAEQKIQEELHVAVSLTDESVLSREDSPLATVGTLADYVSSQLEEKLDGQPTL
jgi:acyl carrier protein